MTDLKRAAEAVVRALDGCGCEACKNFSDTNHVAALRAALQREEPAPNAVITDCVSYDRVLDKAEVEAHWEGYKAELQREETKVELPFKLPLRLTHEPSDHYIFQHFVRDANNTVILGFEKSDWPMLEALVALANRANRPGVCYEEWLGSRLQDEEKAIAYINAAIKDGSPEVLQLAIKDVIRTNRAAPSDAGRELAEMVMAHVGDEIGLGCSECAKLTAKAREVLGKKDGE